jgi:nucleoid-associated protein YgaU
VKEDNMDTMDRKERQPEEDRVGRAPTGVPRRAPKRAPATKFVAEHTVEEGDTLSGIALKYYGSATKDMWMVIYNANKSVIGDDPNLIKPGQVLKIPEKP